jgi:hypothetical protein
MTVAACHCALQLGPRFAAHYHQRDEHQLLHRSNTAFPLPSPRPCPCCLQQYGHTALLAACESGHTAAVEALLTDPAINVDVETNVGVLGAARVAGYLKRGHRHHGRVQTCFQFARFMLLLLLLFLIFAGEPSNPAADGGKKWPH